MSKELEDLLRMFGLIAIFSLIIVIALCRIRKLEKQINEMENAPADTIVVHKTDTIKITEPKIVYKYKKETEYVEIPDTSYIHDTITSIIQLPREYLVYKDSTYRAVVSGVLPRLDSIEVYRPTITNTITKYVTTTKANKWGIGVQAGYGWNGQKVSPYLGVGVQYNIVSW